MKYDYITYLKGVTFFDKIYYITIADEEGEFMGVVINT